MRKTTLLAGLVASLATITGSALAQSASTAFGCTSNHLAAGATTLQIRPADVGRPGFVALVAERGDDMAFLDPAGNWVFSRMPFSHEYRRFTALPSSITFNFCAPEPTTSDSGQQEFFCSMTTRFAAGTTLHATWGALTPETEQQANDRESSMAATNERLISLGREPRSFDRQRFIESAVLRDARMVNPIIAGVVPFVDCTPPDTSGGN